MGNLRKILILSIWDEQWSLGEGSGVPDERHFIDRLREAGVELHFLIPESPTGNGRKKIDGVHFHTYGNVFHRARLLPRPVRRLTLPHLFTLAVYGDLRRAVEKIRPDVVLAFSHLSIEPVSRVGRQMGVPTACKLFGVMYLGREDIGG